jgi:hypothetical protein
MPLIDDTVQDRQNYAGGQMILRQEGNPILKHDSPMCEEAENEEKTEVNDLVKLENSPGRKGLPRDGGPGKYDESYKNCRQLVVAKWIFIW